MVEIYKIKPLPFAYDALDDISEQQLKYHYDVHYAGYVNGRNKVEEQLAEMRKKGEFPDIRNLKTRESDNASGMILHEVYWETLGGEGGEPTGKLAEKMREDFGSFENWKKEIMAFTMAQGDGLSCAST